MTTSYCVSNNYFSLEIGTLAQQYLKSNLSSKYVIDNSRMDIAMSTVRNTQEAPSKDFCTAMAMDVYRKKKIIDENNQRAAEENQQIQNLIKST